MGSMRVAFCVPARLVTDEARLQGVLTQALDQLAAHARACGWQLHGSPSAFIFQPEHAAALRFDVPVPDDPGDFLTVVLNVDAVDELAALHAR